MAGELEGRGERGERRGERGGGRGRDSPSLPLSSTLYLIRKYLENGRLPLHVADALVRSGQCDALTLVPFATDMMWAERFPKSRKPRRSGIARLPQIECCDATLQLRHHNITVLIDPGPYYTRLSPAPDLVIVTHAHYDHVGSLAAVCRKFPEVPVVMTPETAALLTTLNGDGQSDWGALLARHIVSLSATGDAQKLVGLEVRFYPAGHLWGAAMVDLAIAGVRILITGDVCGREVGGLVGFALPDAPYDAVFMEGTHAHDASLPTADGDFNRARLVEQITQHVVQGQKRILISARALGEAQEVYAAVVRAMRGGKLKGWNVQMSGAALHVAKLYAENLASTPYGLWTLPPLACAPRRVGPRTIVIASGTMQDDGSAAQSQWQLWRDDLRATILTPHEDGNIMASYTPRHSPYQVFTHASLGELAYLGLGAKCETIYLYHGRRLAYSPLAEWLRSGGKTVYELANGQMSKWANEQMSKWANEQMSK